MPRIRSTHPGQWTDEQFVACTPLARLLALAIRNEADDNGIFEWNPLKLKIRLLPADSCDINELLGELANSEQVHRYEVRGKSYGLIRNFPRYQKPKSPVYQYPLPEVVPNGYEIKSLNFGSTSEVLTQNGEVCPQREEGGGRGEELQITLPDGRVVGEPHADPHAPSVASEKPRGNGVADCPKTKIVELYHEILPTLPQVQKWTPSREKLLRSRWREHPDVELWRQYFSIVQRSRFLTGKINGSSDRPPFLADFEWLIKPTNFAKVLEGRYDNR